MRVLVVLLALAAMPLGVSVSQESARRRPEDVASLRASEDPKHCGLHLSVADRARGRSAVAHEGRHGVMDRPCGSTEAPPPLPPPLPPPPPPPPAGTVSIIGGVFDGNTFEGMSGWTVNLLGTVNASVTTDPSGSYAFNGLPAGSYTICVAVPMGWEQTMPLIPAGCPSGVGYEFTLVDNEQATWVNFAIALK